MHWIYIGITAALRDYFLIELISMILRDIDICSAHCLNIINVIRDILTPILYLYFKTLFR